MLVSGGQILAIDSVNHDNTLIGDGVNAPLGISAADTYVTVQSLTKDPTSVDKNYVLHWDGSSSASSASWYWQEEQNGGDTVSARKGLQTVVEHDGKYIEMTDQSIAAIDLVSANSAIWEKQQIILTNEAEPTAIPADVVGVHIEEQTYRHTESEQSYIICQLSNGKWTSAGVGRAWVDQTLDASVQHNLETGRYISRDTRRRATELFQDKEWTRISG